MEDKFLEVEIKLWVENLEEIADRLKAANAVLHAERIFERNARFDRPDGSLGTEGLVLRLRQDSRARLTYKEPGTVRDGIMSRFEAEVEVSDFDTMALILEKLGYVLSFVYEKFRTTYLLHDCEVTLDELPFGSFVEVEGRSEDIMRVVSRLRLEEAMRVKMSYASAFDTLRERLDLPFTDATFSNFDAVTLPGNVRELLKQKG